MAGSKRFIGYAEMSERIVTDESSFVTIGHGEAEMKTTKPFKIVWKRMYTNSIGSRGLAKVLVIRISGVVLDYLFRRWSILSTMGRRCISSRIVRCASILILFLWCRKFQMQKMADCSALSLMKIKLNTKSTSRKFSRICRQGFRKSMHVSSCFV